MNYNTIDPLSSAKRVLGKKLLLWAWVIEIITVLIAIFIGFNIAYSEYGERLVQENLKSEYLNILTITLPFLIVAIIGVFKIPFIYIIRTYNNKFVKFLFFIMLIVLTLITFEILRHGLEQHFNKPNIKIEQAQRNILDINNQIDSTNKALTKKKLFTSETILQDEKNKLQEALAEHNNKLNNLHTLKTKYTVYIDDDPKRQIDILKSRIDIYRENLETKIVYLKNDFKLKQIEEQELFSTNKKLKEDKSNEALERLNIAQKELDSFEENHSFYSKENEDKKALMAAKIKELRQEYKDINQIYLDYTPASQLSINDDLNALRNKYNELITKAEIKIFKIENLVIQKHDNSSKLSEITQSLKDEEARYENHVQTINNETTKEFKKLELVKKEIIDMQKSIKDLYKKKDEMIVYIDNIYGQSLIYIATKKLNNASQVTQEQVRFVSTILFALISFVLTFLGIILSFAAFILIFHDYERILRPKENYIKLTRKSKTWLND